jgi:hypothetical protein
VTAISALGGLRVCGPENRNMRSAETGQCKHVLLPILSHSAHIQPSEARKYEKDFFMVMVTVIGAFEGLGVCVEQQIASCKKPKPDITNVIKTKYVKYV